jgi:TonB family protein
MAEIGEAGAGNQAHISGTNNCNPHGQTPEGDEAKDCGSDPDSDVSSRGRISWGNDFNLSGNCHSNTSICARSVTKVSRACDSWFRLPFREELTWQRFRRKLRIRIEAFAPMAQHLIPQPDADPERAARSAETPSGKQADPSNPSSSRSNHAWKQKSIDVASLMGKFASVGGGNLSVEHAAELALEVALNEIVQDACGETGAAGAAVILDRGGEWVCRARSGATPLALGEPVGNETPLIAECIRLQKIQRCDDVEAYSAPDVHQLHDLGVRSVLVIPLMKEGKFAGVLAEFSSSVAAFGEQEERMLQASGARVLDAVAQVAEAAAALPESGEQKSRLNEMNPEKYQDQSVSLPEFASSQQSRALKVATWVVGAVVVLLLSMMAALAGRRLTESKADVRDSAGDSAPATKHSAAENSPAAPTANQATGAATSDVLNNAAPTEPTSTSPQHGQSNGAGGLTVYEDGKEIFRLPPTGKAPLSATPEVTFRVEPQYPEEALNKKIEGAVVLDLQIRRDGSVNAAKLVSGDALLADAAIKAVKQWRFLPRTEDGKPVELQTRITLNFRVPR